MPLVSVIMPAYNAARTIGATLASVLQQTAPDVELIVVDDGSTDGTARVLEELRGRILLIRTGHRGAAAARNRGAEFARGEYLFFCDADLVLRPELLERLTNAAQRMPNVSFFYCAFEWAGHTFGRRAFDSNDVKRNNYISTMSLIRRAHFPGFDESLRRFQDWDLWLTMIERGKVGACVPEVLFSVLSGSSSMSRQGFFSRLRATRVIRKKHRLPMRCADFLLAAKERLRSLWIFPS